MPFAVDSVSMSRTRLPLLMLATVTLALVTMAVSPPHARAASPDPGTGATPAPTETPTSDPQASGLPDPVPSPPDPGATPSPDPAATPTPGPTLEPTPQPTLEPSPTPEPTPGPTPTATPTPTPTPVPVPVPSSLNLFLAPAFRYQDPNYTACTAASAMDMLNFIAIARSGGPGFRWHLTLASSTLDAVLAWERSHDTTSWPVGSDAHGWRNGLNHFGWGDAALTAGNRVYEDMAFAYEPTAIRTAVRQMILTHKPVGVLGWAGTHAQMITGYYGLTGDPFARNANGAWANRFTVAGIYFSDPLRSDRRVNVRVSLTAFRTSLDRRLRFVTFQQWDSRGDDRYTPGYAMSRSEWLGRFVLLVPVR